MELGKKERKNKILFVHGLEANERGIKVQTLKTVDSFDVDCPRMTCTKNIWKSYALIVQELRLFQPDIVVASSYGTILTLLMIQMGVWRGRTILLAIAMGVFAPFRLLPLNPTMQNLVLVVHGKQDRICPIGPVRQWAMQNNVSFLELEDGHSLKSLTNPSEDGTRPLLIKMVFEQMRIFVDPAANTVDNSQSLVWMLFKLTGIVIAAFFSLLARKCLCCCQKRR